MTHFDIAHHRLHNQRLSAAPFRQPGEVVNWLVAVQAQDYAGAKWALGLRMQRAVEDDVERAFADGAILRTHLMRPTWHFVTPADIRWMLALTAPRVHAVNAFMYRKLSLDNNILKRSHAALVNALQGGQQLTRSELKHVLQKSDIATEDGQRLAYIMMSAELDGVVCSGARRGKQFTYALLDERVPPGDSLEREAALAELSRRYFMSRGPATVQDFAKWSGLTIADARRGLEAVKDQLEQLTVGQQIYWSSTSTPSAKDEAPTAHLLSIYDEYISSYKDRRAMGEVEVGDRLKAMGNELSYIIVLEGKIVGTWKRKIHQDAVVIETNLFRSLTPTENQAVVVATQRYGEFLQLPAVLV